VVANDSDPDGDALALVSVSGVGFTLYSSRTVHFTSQSSTGIKTGTYVVGDGRGGTASTTLKVTVSGGTCPGGSIAAPTPGPETPR
jgi:hypothetical protein